MSTKGLFKAWISIPLPVTMIQLSVKNKSSPMLIRAEAATHPHNKEMSAVV